MRAEDFRPTQSGNTVNLNLNRLAEAASNGQNLIPSGGFLQSSAGMVQVPVVIDRVGIIAITSLVQDSFGYWPANLVTFDLTNETFSVTGPILGWEINGLVPGLQNYLALDQQGTVTDAVGEFEVWGFAADNSGIISITSLSADSLGYYPANLLSYDAGAKTFSVASVLGWEINGIAPALQNYLAVRQNPTVVIGSDTLQVWGFAATGATTFTVSNGTGSASVGTGGSITITSADTTTLTVGLTGGSNSPTFSLRATGGGGSSTFTVSDGATSDTIGNGGSLTFVGADTTTTVTRTGTGGNDTLTIGLGGAAAATTFTISDGSASATVGTGSSITIVGADTTTPTVALTGSGSNSTFTISPETVNGNGSLVGTRPIINFIDNGPQTSGGTALTVGDDGAQINVAIGSATAPGAYGDVVISDGFGHFGSCPAIYDHLIFRLVSVPNSLLFMDPAALGTNFLNFAASRGGATQTILQTNDPLGGVGFYGLLSSASPALTFLGGMKVTYQGDGTTVQSSIRINFANSSIGLELVSDPVAGNALNLGGATINLVSSTLTAGMFGTVGKSGTDPIGNAFTNGIVTTIGSGSITVSGGSTGLTGGTVSGSGTITLGGSVSSLQGFPVSSDTPTLGQGFTWDGTEWEPTNHLVTGGSAVTVGSLGSGVTSASATGTDSAGQVTLTASISIAAGKVCTVTFSTAFTSAPVVVCSVDTTSTALTLAAYPANIGTSSFDLYVAGLSGVITGLVINFIAVGAKT